MLWMKNFWNIEKFLKFLVEIGKVKNIRDFQSVEDNITELKCCKELQVFKNRDAFKKEIWSLEK